MSDSVYGVISGFIVILRGVIGDYSISMISYTS